MAFLQFVVLKFGVDLSDHLGLHYWRSTHFRPWQLITHMFMHGSPHDLDLTIMHLFSNMFALWMFGSILENLWGGKRFLIFYFICGLGAALCHWAVLAAEFEPLKTAFYNYQHNPALNNYLKFVQENNLQNQPQFAYWSQIWTADPGCIPCSGKTVDLAHSYYIARINETTVGASGAVFGVLFAFGYLFPNTLLYIYFLVPVKAKYVIAVYTLFELYAGIRNSAGDNVAHFAHLGGMLVAFIILKIWSKTERRKFY